MKGKTVVVTGSTQGIGLAIARAAARAGVDALLLTGRDEAKGQSAAAEVAREGVRAAFIAADLADPAAPDRVFDHAIERLGRVDALVNAAALTDRGSLAEADISLWERLYAVNARAPFLLPGFWAAKLDTQ